MPSLPREALDALERVEKQHKVKPLRAHAIPRLDPK
jgi:hypothetical protein